MTYGEVIMQAREKIVMENGAFTINARLPARMSYDKAAKYYGKKLDDYWLSIIELNPRSKISKIRALQILKGRYINFLKPLSEPKLGKKRD